MQFAHLQYMLYISYSHINTIHSMFPKNIVSNKIIWTSHYCSAAVQVFVKYIIIYTIFGDIWKQNQLIKFIKNLILDYINILLLSKSFYLKCIIWVHITIQKSYVLLLLNHLMYNLYILCRLRQQFYSSWL